MLAIIRILFLRANSRRNDMTSKLAVESSPLVGSSRYSIFGLVISCVATLTLRFCPPLRPFCRGVPMRVWL